MPVRLTRTDGTETVTVDDSTAARLLSAGGWRETSAAETAADAYQAGRRASVSGLGGTIRTIAREALGGATLGGSVALEAGFGDDLTREQIQLDREGHPIAAPVASIAGAVVPALLTGGATAPGSTAATAGSAIRAGAALTPAGAAARLGAALARTEEGASLTARAARGAFGAGAEGSLYAVGQTAQDLSLADDPLTIDRLAGSLSTNFLTLGGGSALGGAALGSLEHGLIASGKRIRLAREAADAAPVIGDDLAALDAAGLRQAREAELATIEAARVPQRAQLADDLIAFRAASKNAETDVGRPWDAVATGNDVDNKAMARKLGKRAKLAASKAEQAAEEAAAQEAADIVARQERLPALEARLGSLRAAADRDEALALSGAGATEAARNRARQMATESRARLRAAEEEIATLQAGGGVRLRAVADQLADEARVAAQAAEEASALAATKYPAWMREDGIVSLKSDRTIDSILNDPKAMSGAAGSRAFNSAAASAQKALRIQEHALELIASKADELAVFHAMDRTGRRAAALQKVPAALERNRDLQRRLGDLMADPASARLNAVTDALASLGERGKLTLAQKAGAALAFGATTAAATGIGGDIPGMNYIAPILGAAAGSAAAARLGGVMATARTASIARQTKALDAFLRGARATRRAAVPLASQVLASVRFAPPVPERRGDKPARATTLTDHYDARAAEIGRVTAPGPDGRPRVTEAARTAIGQRLAPIAAVAPHVADRLESAAVRRLEYVALKMPRSTQIGMTRLRPNELAIRSWARTLAAADDPGGIEERLAEGTLTPEDAEVMRALYPDRLADFVRQVVERLPELRASLPYQRRVMLSILTGAPVDASLDPRILGAIQAQYAAEPDTEGGTQAPRPRPAFGSVKKPEATPAQQRAG